MLYTAIDPTTTIEQAAEKLACALASLPQFHAYLRAERAVHDDPMAVEIDRQISAYGEPYFSFEETPASLTELREKRGALPVVADLYGAKSALAAAFGEVDEIITSVTGLPFAENIRACGST